MSWIGPNIKRNAWHRQFHEELNLFPVDTPTLLYEDNMSSILMSNDLGTPHKRSKHFGIEWAYFKESVELGEIKAVHISTDQQPADMLTKTLPVKKFLYFRDMIMGGIHLQQHFDRKSPGHVKVDVSEDPLKMVINRR